MASSNGYIGPNGYPEQSYDYQWQYVGSSQSRGYQRYPEYQRQPHDYNNQYGYSTDDYRARDQHSPYPLTQSQYEPNDSEEIFGSKSNHPCNYAERYYYLRPGDYEHFTTGSKHSFFVRHQLRFSSLETKIAITEFFDSMAYLDDIAESHTKEFSDKIYGIYSQLQLQKPWFAMVLRGFTPNARQVIRKIKKEHEELNFSTPCPHNGHTTRSRPNSQEHQTTRLLVNLAPQLEPETPFQQANETGQFLPVQETRQLAHVKQADGKPIPAPRKKFMSNKIPANS
ncbi:hypothetical protein D5018_10940 [Parashewanella curva]|uniref:Uncharacterized protein n=1 Tax=Parashewanella curva TaxID=2338552 RepID=A0A3L8PZY5_9GAMM|nr:hypothetical protein [Parashewanella curva]RLV59662.1 hypothetical protein D5018_10940 [Parashewanella curva]